MTKEVLVTGGAGFVGSSLVPILLEEKYSVRVIDNLIYKFPSLINCFNKDNFKFIKGDVRNQSDVKKAVEGVDFIIHLAGLVGAPACERDKALARELNLDSTIMLEKFRDKSTGFIFPSTGSVYGRIEGICTEMTKPNPLSTYGITKFEAEQYLLGKENVVVYRPATAFGVSPRMRLDLLVNDLTFKAVKNKYVLLYDRNARRTFIDVSDFAYALKFAVENFKNLKNDVYNLGHESLNHTKLEVCNKINEIVPFSIHSISGSDLDQRDYEVSYKKIRDKGFQVKTSLSDGIKRLIKVYDIIDIHNPYTNADY
ncbi:NAD(P)-dependent oxidoreductase [Candidatus Pacearchaeota archaeon]|nr:NAD(P)-dependent oxidoreductase [Candidatus Pacearchaeota archaeon]